MNHISLIKGRPRCYAKSPTAQDASQLSFKIIAMSNHNRNVLGTDAHVQECAACIRSTGGAEIPKKLGRYFSITGQT